MNLFVKSSISALLICVASSATAQERVNAFDDWAVAEASNPKQCWISSIPEKIENTRSGKPVVAKRGEIGLFINYIPSENVVGEVSFSGGYPFAENQPVSLTIGNAIYGLVKKGEQAWGENVQIDQKIRVSMTKGAKAVVTAQSSRGTKTKDTFSLKGFTAALNDAKKRCGIN